MSNAKKKVTLELTFSVTFSTEDPEDTHQLEENMHYVAQRAIEEGMLTGYRDEEVEDYSIDVGVVEDEPKEQARPRL